MDTIGLTGPLSFPPARIGPKQPKSQEGLLVIRDAVVGRITKQLGRNTRLQLIEGINEEAIAIDRGSVVIFCLRSLAGFVDKPIANQYSPYSSGDAEPPQKE